MHIVFDVIKGEGVIGRQIGDVGVSSKAKAQGTPYCIIFSSVLSDVVFQFLKK